MWGNGAGASKRAALQDAANKILSVVPGGINGEVQANTPRRFAQAWEEVLEGYDRDSELKQILTSFQKEGTQHLVAVTGIQFYSVCEHHLLPFFGKAHVGYIPNARIIGASKLPRLVKIFSSRLQLQERLTHQIAEALQKHLEPLGVAVVVEGEHLCMAMRGVRASGSTLITSEMLGIFRTDPAARAEFLALYRGK